MQDSGDTRRLRRSSPDRLSPGKRVCATLLAALLFTGHLLGQNAGSPLPSADTFTLRQNVRAVTLDVVVTDSKGHPVEGLTKEDFHITEDGAPQKVEAFEAPYTIAAHAAQGTESVPPSTAGEPPATILLLDEVSTGQLDLAYGRAQLLRFLQAQPEQLPQPTSLLILTGSQLHVASDLTRDREQLIQGLKSDPGITSWYAMRDYAPGFQGTFAMTAFARLRTYLETVSQIAAANAGRPGRKNLVWIGPGLLALSAEGTNLRARTIAANAVRRASAMMLDARMTMYTVDPQGLLVTPTQTITPDAAGLSVATAQDPAEGELAFEQLALETGGRIFRMRNDVGAEIGEGVRDGAVSYTLAYTPSNRDFNGKFRRIRVTVDRPGLTARTREGYDALPDTTPSEQQVEMDLELALTSTLRYSAIPVNAHELAGSSPPQLEISAQLSGLRFQTGADGRRAADVEIVTGLIAEGGKIVDSHRTVHRVWEASSAVPADATWTVPLTATQPLGKEKIRSVRVLVRDRTSGAIGSYDLPLTES